MTRHELKAQVEQAKDNLMDAMNYSDCIQEAEGHFQDWKEAAKQLNELDAWDIEQEEQAYRDAERRFGC